MSIESNTRGRVRGLAAAVRFAWIPAACAIVIAIASAHPRGTALALALLLPALLLGIIARALEITSEPRADG